MKKILLTTLTAIFIASSLIGCAKKEENNTISKTGESKEASETVTGGADEETKIVVTEPENNEAVNIYFPKEAFEGASKENIEKDAENMNATATINEDGSVIYTMTKESQKLLLSDLKEGLTDLCIKIPKDPKYTFIKEISLNENLENITVKLDKAEFEAQENISFSVIEKNCLGYQTVNGVKPEDLEVTLHLIDTATNTEFKTELYGKDGVKNN